MNPDWVKGVSGNPNGRPVGAKDKRLDVVREIENASTPEERKAITAKLIAKAKSGSYNHLQLYLQYYWGKPAEKLHVTSDERQTPIDLDQLSESAITELVKSTEGVIFDEDHPRTNGRSH